MDAAAATSVKLYVGNLSYNTEEATIRSLFAEHGEVTDVYMPADRETGRPRGFALVTIETSDVEGVCGKMNGQDVDGRPIKVNESKPRGEENRGGDGGSGFNSSGAASVKLFVGNLAFDTTEDTVRSLFEEHGEVTDIYMPTDRETGRPRGFSFVTMSAEDAETACEKMDGQDVDGRPIKVNESKPKGRGGGGGGRYGGGGGGGRRYGGGGGGY